MRFSSSLSDICVAPESQGGFEREQIREQIGGFIGHFSMGRLRRFLSGIIYGNPFRAGTLSIPATSWKCLKFCHIFNFYLLQKTGHLRSLPIPTPTWTTWWPTTMRKLPAWQTCLRRTWGKALTHGSTSSNTTSQKGPVRSAAWESRRGRLFTAVWSAQLGDRNTSGCMWCLVLTSGTKRWGEKKT